MAKCQVQFQRNELLEFVTGSSTLPVGGFKSLPGYGGPLLSNSVDKTRLHAMSASARAMAKDAD